MIELARHLLLSGWVRALGVLLGGALLGWLFRTVLLRRLRVLSRRTLTHADDDLVAATRGFWVPGLLLLAALPASRFAPLLPDHRQMVERGALGGLLLVVTLVASRFVGLRFQSATRRAGELPGSPSLIQKVCQAVVVVAGTLLVLDNAGVEIKTLLTALGVGSLAVALALQPTLSNLFAGLHLSVAKPLRVGDFVELEDGTQGHVVDIGWRTTAIRQLPNNLVFVPNAKLVDMRLINFTLPDPPQSIVFPLGVAYGSDLRQVERVVVEVARGVQQEVPEADATHEPFIRFNAFADSSIDMSVILRARQYTDRWLVIHEFMLRLEERFDRDGIEIPFPQRVVHLPARAQS